MDVVGGSLALLPAACGSLVWRAVGGARCSRLECAAYSVPIGVVLVSAEMMVASRLGRQYTTARLLVPLAVLGLACVAGRSPRAAAGIERGATGWLGRAALALIVAESSVLVWDVAASPAIVDWDGWAIWGMKAKAFFVDRSVIPYLSHADLYEFSWPFRPCLTSLYQAFVYLCLGRADEGAARLAHLVLTASLLLVFFADLRRRFNRDHSLVWTAVLITVPNLTYQCSAGVANPALGLYLFGALASLDGWEARRGLGRAAGPALLLGGALLARDEGVFLGGLVMFGAFVVRPPRVPRAGWREVGRACAVIVLVTGALYGLWAAQERPRTAWDIRSTWLDPTVPARLFDHRHDVAGILGAVTGELVRPLEQARSSPLEQALHVALVWPLFASACLFQRRVWRTDPMGFRSALIAGSGIAAYTLGFLAFPYQDLADIENNWIYVLDRHAIALLPFAVRAMASAFSAPAGGDRE